MPRWCRQCGCSQSAHSVRRRRRRAPCAQKTFRNPPVRKAYATMDAMRRQDASHVFYRKLNRELKQIVRGEGVYLVDASGKRYLDACGGAMVVSVGHGVKEIGDAIGAQAVTIAYVNGTMFTTEPVERLAGALIERAPQGIEKAYFLSSGSEAVEAALKLARQYHVERGESSRRIII